MCKCQAVRQPDNPWHLIQGTVQACQACPATGSPNHMRLQAMATPQFKGQQPKFNQNPGAFFWCVSNASYFVHAVLSNTVQSVTIRTRCTCVQVRGLCFCMHICAH